MCRTLQESLQLLLDESPIASKARGWQLSSSIGVGFTSSSYRPEDQTGVSQTTLTNLDAPPIPHGDIAALYRTTYFSYGASISAQYNRLTQERVPSTNLTTRSYRSS